jgi:hypothetical protein
MWDLRALHSTPRRQQFKALSSQENKCHRIKERAAPYLAAKVESARVPKVRKPQQLCASMKTKRAAWTGAGEVDWTIGGCLRRLTRRTAADILSGPLTRRVGTGDLRSWSEPLPGRGKIVVDRGAGGKNIARGCSCSCLRLHRRTSARI